MKSKTFKVTASALRAFYESEKSEGELAQQPNPLLAIHIAFDSWDTRFVFGEHVEALTQVFGHDFAKFAREAYWTHFNKCSCPRCGGAGGWTGWPGFTCYECRGAGWIKTK